jgi:hypothetical protein
MRYFIRVGKRDIHAIARKPTMITEGLQEAVFSVRSDPTLYNDAPRQPECNRVK